MNLETIRRAAVVGIVTGTSLALAGCGGPPPPPPAPPPPPPAQVAIPARPIPPFHASPTLEIPALRPDGTYDSVDRGITPAQTVWNLRSALNVAALNCGGPGGDTIRTNYAALIKKHAKGFAAANATSVAEFKAHYGAKATTEREAYMTRVYNHFATPATETEFCNAALAVGNDAAALKPADLQVFADRNLPAIEAVFDQFWRRYSQYRADLAEWNQRYGTK